MVDVNGERGLRGVINYDASDNEETDSAKDTGEGAEPEKKKTKKKPSQEDGDSDPEDGTDTTYKEEL